MSKIFNALHELAVRNDNYQLPIPVGQITWHRDSQDTIVKIGLDKNRIITFRRTKNNVIHVTSTCGLLWFLPTDPLNEHQLRVVCRYIEDRLNKTADEIKNVVMCISNLGND